MLSCPWREASAEDGKKYYYHARTKQTSWTKPKVCSIYILPTIQSLTMCLLQELEDVEKLIASQHAGGDKPQAASAVPAIAAVVAAAAAGSSPVAMLGVVGNSAVDGDKEERLTHTLKLCIMAGFPLWARLIDFSYHASYF